VAIWMPVRDRRRGRLAWAIPYMFVDADAAMAGGREIYGFPKQMGRMDIPHGDRAPQAMSVDALTIRTFGPGSVAKEARVVAVRRDSGVPVKLHDAWRDPASALRDLIALALRQDPLQVLDVVNDLLRDPLGRVDETAALAAAPVLLARDLAAGSVHMVLLKQFRDATYSGAACYQAIVEVANEVTGFHGGGLLPDDYQVEFAELAGEPVLRELGIAAGPRHVSVAFWVEFDFLVHAGTVLWDSGA
jgi:hypothetical protein